jgi:hypothetical protein
MGRTGRKWDADGAQVGTQAMFANILIDKE